MTNIIIGILIGMVFWQLLVSVIGSITEFDNEKVLCFLCGVWYVLFYIFVRPIGLLIGKIIRYCFYSKYLKCEFMEDDEVCSCFYIDKNIAKTYETSPDKKFYVNITKAKNNYYPYRDNIITKEKIEMHPEKYKFFDKWKRID